MLKTKLKQKKTNRDVLLEEKNAFASAARIKYYDIVLDHGRGGQWLLI